MPKVVVVIEYDDPQDTMWLNPDNIKICLEAYCINTKFKVTWAPGGNPWKTKEGDFNYLETQP